MKKYRQVFIWILMIWSIIMPNLAKADDVTPSPVLNKPILRVKLVNGKYMDKITEEVLNKSYDVRYVEDEDYDVVISSSGWGNYDSKIVQVNNKAVKIFITGEAAVPNIDDYDLVTGPSRIDNPKYIRIPYYYYHPPLGQKIAMSDKMRDKFNGICAPQKKEIFACFLVTNGMKEINPHIGNGLPFDGTIARDRLFHKLSLYKEVESGGRHLNNLGKLIPGEETNEWLSRCKFVIAYENQSYDGYITEKVFQAYFAGTIPIYYSHPNAVLDVNKKAIIYAGDFADEDALVEYIKKVDNDDKLYCDIWNENLITNPEINFELVKDKFRQKFLKLINEKLNK